MSGCLLDTNVLSELRRVQRANPRVRAWFEGVDEGDLFVSVLALGEIRNGIERIRASDPVQAQALERWLRELERSFAGHVLPVTAAIADRWGRLNAPNPMPVVDSLMAATALEHDLILITRDVQDVAPTGVGLLNPFLPSESH